MNNDMSHSKTVTFPDYIFFRTLGLFFLYKTLLKNINLDPSSLFNQGITDVHVISIESHSPGITSFVLLLKIN